MNYSETKPIKLVNNPQLYQDVVYKMGKFLQCIHRSVRYNAIFGTEHLNDGIMEAAVRNSNVGECANAEKFTRGNVISSDEWFAIKLKSEYSETIQSGIVWTNVAPYRHAEAVWTNAKKKSTMVIDMHKIKYYGKKPTTI